MTKRFLLAAIAGVTLGYAYNHAVWWLAPIAIAVFIRQMESKRRSRRMLTAAIFLSFYWVSVISWIKVLGMVPLVLLTAICLLPFLAVALWSRLGVVSFAALWVLAEFIHSEFPWGGFPWGLIAYTQTDGPIVETARIGGQYLTTFIVLVLAGLLARSWPPASWWKIAALAGAVVMVHFALPDHVATETIKVAAIQGSVPRAGYDFETQRRAVLNNHVQATRDFLVTGESDVALVIWPENAVDNDPINTKFVNDTVNALSRNMAQPLLVGGLVARGNTGQEFNAGILWSHGKPSQMYAKHQLVPFGEYIPTGNFMLSQIEKYFAYLPRMVPGTTNGIFELPNGVKFGDVICFEIANENFVRERVRDGAAFITVQTNNATYENTRQPAQQLNITRFRAIENQRNIVVAATTGYTVIIDSNGRVVHSVPNLVSGYIVGDVQLSSAQEFVQRWNSHWVTFLCLIFTIVGVRKSYKVT